MSARECQELQGVAVLNEVSVIQKKQPVTAIPYSHCS